MKYWRVKFDDGSETFGWLVMSDELVAQRLTDDEGNDITHGISYTTIETEGTPPGWA